MVEDLSDAALVLRIARGDDPRDAEAELYRRFAPRVRLYGLRHLRSEDRASDLVQGVLLAVLEAARAGRIEDADKVDRFVLGTCRNVAQRVRERDARAIPVVESELEHYAGAAEPTFQRVDTAALLRCLRKLDTRARTVVTLTFQAEAAADEIAKILEISVGNVRVLRHRALSDLRGCLDSGGPLS